MEHRRNAQSLLTFVQDRGIVTSREIETAGFPRIAITRGVRAGELQRLGKGIYARPDHTFSEWHDLATISRAVPSAIIALISALAYHEIGTQLAYELWIALPEGSREPSYHQKLRTTRFSEPYYSAGIQEHEIEGSTVRIYSAAKTVADCFRMRSKVGYDVAIEALKEGWRLGKFTLDELNCFSKLNKVDRVMRPYVEAILL